MLKIIVLFKVFITNKFNGIEDGNKLIKKFVKLKIRKLSKIENFSKS